MLRTESMHLERTSNIEKVSYGEWKLLRRALQAIGLDAISFHDGGSNEERSISERAFIGLKRDIRTHVNCALDTGWIVNPHTLGNLIDYTIGINKCPSFVVESTSEKISNPYYNCSSLDEVKVMTDLLSA